MCCLEFLFRNIPRSLISSSLSIFSALEATTILSVQWWTLLKCILNVFFFFFIKDHFISRKPSYNMHVVSFNDCRSVPDIRRLVSPAKCVNITSGAVLCTYNVIDILLKIRSDKHRALWNSAGHSARIRSY